MRRLVCCLLVVLVAACGGGDSTTSPPAAQSIAGTWTLQTINGQGLPYVVVQTGANKVELVSDVYTISGTGSFTQTSTIRATINGAVSTESVADAGSYTVSGTAVNMRWNSDGSTGTASWSGNTLTATDAGLALVYRR